MNIIQRFVYLIIVFGVLLCQSCSKEGEPVVEVKKSSDKAIIAFGFSKVENPSLSEDYFGVVNGTNISVSVPSNTDISGLRAFYTTSAKTSIKVGTVVQTERMTPNNFSAVVVYTVTAEDGTTQNYTVSVVFSDKTMISFAFLKSDNPMLTEDSPGQFTGTTIGIRVSSGADLTSLKATFTSSAKSTVKVGEVVQQSKITSNNFSVAVVYTVCAEDGSKQDYTILVSKMSEAKTIFTFGLNKAENPQLSSDCHGIINGTSIVVVVPFKTDISSLKASFTVSPKASVRIGSLLQQDKITVNNFSGPLNYQVIAEDGSTITYNVSVKWAPNTAKELVSFLLEKARNSLLPYDVVGIVNSADKRVTCVIPMGVPKNNLIATFTLSERAVAKVGTIVQVSGSTANSFSGNPIYDISAEDGSVASYTLDIKDESLPEIVQSRVDNKILALNLHRYPSPQHKLFSGIQVVPLYSATFLSQKPSSCMPFDAGFIGSDGKVYVTTPFSAEQKAVFKDATQVAIYYMCQLFLSNYYMKSTFPIWFKFGMAAFEAELTISDDDVKSAIQKYGGQLPPLGSLNDPVSFANKNGLAIAYMWGEFMALGKTWQYYDILEVNEQTVVVAPYVSWAPLDKLYAIWNRYVASRILEPNEQKRRKFQGESSHFKFYCADKDAFCISGFTTIVEKAYTEYSGLLNISFPEKLAFSFAPECETAIIEGVECGNRYTSGTGIVSGMFTSSPNSVSDVTMWNHLLRHELGHCFVFRLYPAGFQPTAWFSEGAAEFLAYGVMNQERITDCKIQVRDAMKGAIALFGHRPTYDDTKVYPGNPYYDYYILGQTLLNFVYQKGGYTGVRNVLSHAEDGIKSLGYPNHDAFMNGYYDYFDSVWNN